MKIGNSNTDELQVLLNESAAAVGTVGAQVSVVVGGQRADLVYGTANAELNNPMTMDTVTQLGSATKLFNAAIVMSLVDEGRLALDAPVTDYIPGLSLGGKSAPQGITLRRLLSMSAGLEMGPLTGFNGENALGRYVAMLNEVPLCYPPGQGFSYSNASVCIAALAAEKVTGLGWDTLLKKRVFEPMSLKQAGNAPGDMPYLRVAVGHTPVQSGQPVRVYRPWYTNESLNPSGSGLTIVMSAHDLATFGQMFLNRGMAANGHRVLAEKTVQAMMTPTTSLIMGSPHWGIGDSWGLGPTMAKWGSTAVWGHGGSTLGGSSLVLWFPDKHAIMSFTMNTPIAFESFAVRVTGDFSEALVGVRAPARPTAPATPVSVDRPERLVGTYLRYGVRTEVLEQAGHLRYQEFNDVLAARMRDMGENSGGGGGKPFVDQELIALGDDRFLVHFPGFDHGMAVFFFGKDEQGRATHINLGLRSARRE